MLGEQGDAVSRQSASLQMPSISCIARTLSSMFGQAYDLRSTYRSASMLYPLAVFRLALVTHVVNSGGEIAGINRSLLCDEGLLENEQEHCLPVL
jgi:hypothetical protein